MKPLALLDTTLTLNLFRKNWPTSPEAQEVEAGVLMDTERIS
jgi:hypothetical protein